MGLQQRLHTVVGRVPWAVRLLRPGWRLAASGARRSRVWLRTWGRGRLCPCCGWRGRRFLPAGVVRRPEALCPRCGALERYRLLSLYLRDRTDFFSGHRLVLEVGPAACFARVCRSLPGVTLAALDVASPEANVRGDITRLPFAGGSFDLIICYHVLEYIRQDRVALRELWRVLRPGGFGIFQVPLRSGPTDEDPEAVPAERLRRFGLPDHLRLYGDDYADRLRDAGFEVRIERHPDQDDAARCRRQGLDAAERIFRVARPGGVATSDGKGGVTGARPPSIRAEDHPALPVPAGE